MKVLNTTPDPLGGLPIKPELQTQDVAVKEIVHKFLTECGTQYFTVPYSYDLHALCIQDAIRRGCVMDGEFGMQHCIPGGVVMAMTAFAHLDNQATRILIALYTAFLIFLDDSFPEAIELVASFNLRFIRKELQGHASLDAFAQILRELPHHFGSVSANIMVSSSLNFVTALSLEHEVPSMTISPSAGSFSTFSRVMSGASECYALFTFPPELPLNSFVQALPDMMTYINNGNDVLSFYGEECSGETSNRVSILATCEEASKHDILLRLVADASACHHRVLGILALHPASLEAYGNFARGYIGFHTSTPRYKLNDLFC
ncbi:hypothetical protein PLEOSDRAFT_155013 [Pleurotus ostreatus PC15]|uniref:Terpenoid synthase n=2 Tax=Pleurotus TaxID=5320 RepID=A0A067NQL2_PLEO1|nr:hypothetical protein CCMSSC00406_0000067 [Pleurotus cornucopiae]KDQ30328.1 hypothetical protein PLEOSDRAFT_155013 [Pleurotus ostreatus PC15]